MRGEWLVLINQEKILRRILSEWGQVFFFYLGWHLLRLLIYADFVKTVPFVSEKFPSYILKIWFSWGILYSHFLKISPQHHLRSIRELNPARKFTHRNINLFTADFCYIFKVFLRNLYKLHVYYFKIGRRLCRLGKEPCNIICTNFSKQELERKKQFRHRLCVCLKNKLLTDSNSQYPE